MRKQALLYRVSNKQHVCPFGLRALHLLKQQGYEVVDNALEDPVEIEKFKKQHEVKTTPQIFIDQKRIGGFEDLQEYLGIKNRDSNQVTYKPVIAIFSMTVLIATMISWNFFHYLDFSFITQYFVGLTMCILALMKFKDIDSFSNQFITYDLVAQRWLIYAYVYPFAEAIAGLGMIANMFMNYIATISLLIGGIGSVSVVKAVYIDKRELQCACVGGNSRVPLGFISLSENLAMVFMGIMILFTSIY